MTFYGVVTLAIALLQYKQRIPYAALKQEFDLDDDGLEALRFELIQVEQVAVDQDGDFLVWDGGDGQEQIAAQPPIPPVRSSTPEPDPISAQPAATPSDAVPQAAPPPVMAPAADAERRQLTVLFCDLVGSTELSTKLDPEDLQEIIRTYQDAATRAIRAFDGFIAKYMGDGILVYFGYPQATEWNAEAAVKTALGIIQAMPAVNESVGRSKGVEIAVRIGVATGIVVVGEIVGEGEAQERTVVGESPNLAARLQDLARPNGIVIGSVTKDLVGDLFILEDLGDHPLKGITGRVKAWGVIGESDAEGQLELERTTSAMPLVGRQEEIGLLTRAWEGSREGRGQVVLVQGEAGIGKTRLLEALRAHVGDSGYTWVASRSSPYHTATTLHPVIEHLKRAMRWSPEDSAQRNFDRLEKMLGELPSWPVEESAPLYAALLSLTLPVGRYAPLDMTPKQQRDATLDALNAGLLDLAERQPVLAVWEDLHWADPTTVELLGQLIDQVPTAAMVVVATYRPEFVPTWPARSHITPITLNRLERTEVEAIVTNLAGGKAMPVEVMEHIVTKADGVPLYVEELTKTILQSEVLKEADDHFALTGMLADMRIPETLQASLLARLDRVPMAREVAQIGAVLGREFDYAMLASLAPHDEPVLQNGLGQLVENDLLYQRGRGQRAHYMFKHALIQDAAYQSLLKRSRRQYHRQVARLLEERFPEIVEAHPELAAHHHTQAGGIERAIAYLHKAGQLAARLWAHQETVTHLSKALELLEGLPNDAARAHLELDLLVAIGPSLSASKGYAAPESGQVFMRARDLCAQLGEEKRRPPIFRGLAVYHLARGETQAAREVATDFHEFSEQTQDEGAKLFGSYALGNSLMFSGEVKAAREHLAKADELYDAEKHKPLALVYNIDVGVGAKGFEAICLWLLGYPDQALQKAEAMLSLGRRQAHPYSLSYSWNWKTLVHQFLRDPDAVSEHADKSLEYANENGFPLFVAWSKALLGWALAARGEHRQGVSLIREGLDDASKTGSQNFRPFFKALLAEALIAGGQADIALKTVQDELALDAEERLWLPELHRLRGELSLGRSLNSKKKAERCFEQSLEIARDQEAKSLELRAATSLARLWQDQSKRSDARELLAPVYEWFTEGFDTADLQEAKSLLDDLHAEAPPKPVRRQARRSPNKRARTAGS